MVENKQMSLSDYKIDVVRIKLVPDRTLYCKTPINTPEDAVDMIGREIADWDRETIVVLNMDARNRIINMNIAAIGTLNYCIADIRELMKSIILSNANRVILMHNHPSGDTSPSQEDMELTSRFISVCKLMGVEVMDHIIVGNDNSYNFYSFANNNMLNPSKEVFEIVDDTKKKKKKTESMAAEKKPKRVRKL